MRVFNAFNAGNALNLSGIAVILVVGVLSAYVTLESNGPWLVVAALSGVQLLAFVMFVSGWAARNLSIQRLLLWLQAAVILILYLLVSTSFVAILGIVWIVQATELLRARTANWLLLAAILAFSMSQFYHWGAVDLLGAIVSSITLGLFHVFAMSTTRRAIQEQELRQQTAALNRELIATRDLLSQSTRQNERLRIARDLHDILGHHMTALILNLEAATHSSGEKAREKVEQSQSLARLLLSDLRTAVSELREDDAINLEQAVHKLVADIPGLEFDVDFSEAPQIREVEQAETLLRCVQESVTNVMKHSDADRCRIRLTASHGECVLTVIDNGGLSSAIDPGNGLKGMRERVNAGGGTLTWQSDPAGFSLQVQLPAVTG
jgi:signal transduction histidine kinase